MKNSFFTIIKKSIQSLARVSILKTPHGKIAGPFFMPIATCGAVKNVTSEELYSLGAAIILSNTFHLLVRPGMKLIKKYGGLHSFMNWSRPILTDSGGFQIFSLHTLRSIQNNGVWFKDPYGGKTYFLSPQSCILFQNIIGSDIVMVLDVCESYPCSEKRAKRSVDITLRWAKQCQKKFAQIQRSDANAKRKLLFGIVQGSIFKDLRVYCAKELVKLNFDGYAIGGVAVGEPREKMKEVLHWIVHHLPENRPRYLMGVGRPQEILYAVENGIDMFDCVIPTREARHGRLYVYNDKISLEQWILSRSKILFYKTHNIYKSKEAKNLTPLNSDFLKNYSFAYLHHLFRINEGLAFRMATVHNVWFYLDLMKKIRECIQRGVI